MTDDARPPAADGPSRAARWGRRAVVFAVVVAAAALLGRLGSGVDQGPAPSPPPADDHASATHPA